MPKISEFYGIKIYMYPFDHNPPHFHAIYEGSKIVVDIRNLSIIEGKIKPRATSMILEWAAKNQDKIMVNREKALLNDKLDNIDGLE